MGIYTFTIWCKKDILVKNFAQLRALMASIPL